MNLKNKNILVLGAGISGISASKVLQANGANVTLADNKSISDFSAEAKELASIGITLIGDGFPNNVNNYDLAVISPGIPTNIEICNQLKINNIPLIGELELAYILTTEPFIAITGTNGKTTTTSLIGHIFTTAGINNLVGGNIGIPLAVAVNNLNEPTKIIAEVSSFQLETTDKFKPQIALVLNLTPDHLDRHGNMQGYASAKEKVFANQTNQETLVLNWDNEYTKDMATKTKANLCFFSSKEKLANGVYLNNEIITIKDNNKTLEVIKTDELFIKGPHNIENALAATAVCYNAGIEIKDIAAALKTFKGVEHRQEFVEIINGVTYINDSKGTNPDSTFYALKAYDKQILLLGGYDKNSEYDILVPLIKEKVKTVIVYGATKDKIKKTLQDAGYTNVIDCGTDFNLAVNTAKNLAIAGDIVMLSPACASWDMFKSFEQRGQIFKEIVRG